MRKNNNDVTLAEVFRSTGLIFEHLTLDSLGVKVNNNTFNRFDNFRAKYNPLGSNEIREIFLKKDNYMKGAYYAKLMKEVYKKTETYGQSATEYRISVYGTTSNDWSVFSNWLISKNVISPVNRWMVQFPRIYHILKHTNAVRSFQDYLDRKFFFFSLMNLYCFF